MKRWSIGAIAAVSAALAAGTLLMTGPADPSTVRSAEHIDKADDAEDTDAAVGDRRIPLRSRGKLGDRVRELDRTGGNPYAVAARKARTTPETELSARIQSGWVRIGQLLSPYEATDPNAAALRADSRQLLQDLRDLRRHPEAYDWAQLEKRQSDLLARLKASPYASAEMQEIAAHLDQKVADYHAGVFSVVDGAPPDEPTDALKKPE